MGAGRDRSGADERPEELSALRAENDALRARIASLVAAIELMDDAVFVKGGDGRYRMINSAGARLLGRSRDEVVGKDDAELFEAETAERLRMDDRSIIAEGAARTYEEVATSSGVTRTSLVTKGPYRDDRGLVAGLVGISRDITAWRRDGAALRETRQFLTRLLDHAPAMIYVTSIEGHLRMVNRVWEDLLGMRREDVLGRSVVDLFPPEEAERFLRQNRRVVDDRGPRRGRRGGRDPRRPADLAQGQVPPPRPRGPDRRDRRDLVRRHGTAAGRGIAGREPPPDAGAVRQHPGRHLVPRRRGPVRRRQPRRLRPARLHPRGIPADAHRGRGIGG